MKILLFNASQTKFPNLALMKLSAYHKKQGDQVYCNTYNVNPDIVYISCPFPRDRPYALSVKKMWESLGVKVVIGGYGISKVMLPPEIEHIMPDYSLYSIDYSMGYTTRGCIRNCPFCIVPKVEGKLKEWSPITEFWNKRHKKIILLDNNFLASPKWKQKLEFLRDKKLKVNFNQGLDIRLLTREMAELLRQVKYYDWKFRNRRLHFAWDMLEIEDEVERGIRTLKEAGFKMGKIHGHIMFYVLVGFGVKKEDYTYEYFMEHDYYRFKKLIEWKAMPYIMVYNDRRDLPILRHFERWVNRRYYQFILWEKYLKSKMKKLKLC